MSASRSMARKISLDVQQQSRLPNIPAARQFRKWIAAALEQDAELALRIVNAAEGRNLNSAFRGKDYATNVLTFVYHEPETKGKPRALSGDIVLCAPIVAREAREQGKPLMAHYAHLTIHGALHLAGFDHEKERDAKLMEAREKNILAALGYPDPYTADYAAKA
jgi:probable rRNA maturation factor